MMDALWVDGLIATGATIVGAIAGLGGGVIIKPCLDFAGDYDLATIGVLSACTVFSMSVVSLLRQIMGNVRIAWRKTTLIAVGALLGGILGEELLKVFLVMSKANIVETVQNFLLCITLIFIVTYMKNRQHFPMWNIQNLGACMLLGMFMGTASSFLSIGGGPINVCLLTMFLSMPPKEAVVNSILTIFFSQGAQIITIAITRGNSAFALPALPLMVMGGVLGGLLGSQINRCISSEKVVKVFNAVMVILVLLTGYNMLANTIL